MRRFKAGIIQFDIRRGDLDGNLRTVKQRILTLAKNRVRLIVLPEMWSVGFANKHLHELAETTPGVLEDLSGLARQYKITIIGSLPEKKGRDIFNTAYVCDADGSIVGSYRKVHLFSPTRENQYFKPGRKAVIATTSLGPIGLMICYDLRFPELCRALTMAGAPVVAVMAAWPGERRRVWDLLLRARAVENQLFILGANRCGSDNDLAYAGHSRIVSPDGEVLSRAGKRPAVLSATIDLRVVEQTRKHIPCLKETVPEAYKF